MNSTLKKNCPGDAPQLLLILNVPALPTFHLIFPENNFFATGIFAQMLDAKLELAGQLTKRTSFSGAFNSAILSLFVRQVPESLRIIRGIVERNNLAYCAEIYLWDGRELAYRRSFPTPGDVILHQDLMKKVAAAGADFHAQAMRLLELLPKQDSD